MKGTDLLAAVSFVDETWIEEAQRSPVRSRSAAVWRWGAVAACLCLIWLAVSLPRFAAGRDAAVSTVADRVAETVQSQLRSEATAASTAPAKVLELPSVVLRIGQWNETGFTATVEALVDTDIFPVGTVLNAELAESVRAQEPLEDAQRDCVSRQADFPEGSLVQVQFEWDPEDPVTIRVTQITPAE